MAVVAVPFILYLVRFCSPKPCKQYIRRGGQGDESPYMYVPVRTVLRWQVGIR